jgi:hypothetical protein
MERFKNGERRIGMIEGKVKPGNDYIIIAFGLILLVYTALRTIDFTSLTLPANLWWFGVFALVALDAGVIGWCYYYTHHAQSEHQETIAGWLIGFDLVGVGVTLFADTLHQASANGLNAHPGEFTFWAIIGQNIVIFVNIVAAAVTPLLSPQARLTRKTRRIYHDLEEKTLQAIEAASGELAAEAARIRSNEWLHRQREQLKPHLRPRSKRLTIEEGEETSGQGGNELEEDEPDHLLIETVTRKRTKPVNVSSPPAADGGPPVNFRQGRGGTGNGNG